MSIGVMDKVFKSYPSGGGEMLLALALADHADDGGNNIFPSVTVARITETSLRQAMRAGVLPGHLEWVGGDIETYRALIMATRRIQADVRRIMGVAHA